MWTSRKLATLFQMLQSKVMAGEAALSAANDPHAGHAHAQDEAEEIAVASEPTHMLSVEQIWTTTPARASLS